ncbi:MAG: hypothetical protein D6772_08060 [Bacteroidetes bacterium]|nr:MAG: hypothetical protein D6772_08060 [Bacteroidota bacterium]
MAQRFKLKRVEADYKLEESAGTLVTSVDQMIPKCLPSAPVQGEELVDYCTRQYDPFPQNRPDPEPRQVQVPAESDELWIYPNPFVDALTVELPAEAVG